MSPPTSLDPLLIGGSITWLVLVAFLTQFAKRGADQVADRLGWNRKTQNALPTRDEPAADHAPTPRPAPHRQARLARTTGGRRRLSD